MQGFIKILTAIGFLLLLGVSVVRPPMPVNNGAADTASALCTETEVEVVMVVVDEDHSCLEAHHFPGLPGEGLLPSGKSRYYVHRTAGLPWQHGDGLLLPPELTTALL